MRRGRRRGEGTYEEHEGLGELRVARGAHDLVAVGVDVPWMSLSAQGTAADYEGVDALREVWHGDLQVPVLPQGLRELLCHHRRALARESARSGKSYEVSEKERIRMIWHTHVFIHVCWTTSERDIRLEGSTVSMPVRTAGKKHHGESLFTTEVSADSTD